MYNDPQQNDPTEYQRPIEPMQAAYRNPYETPNPYYGDVPPPPPPPPSRQRHIGLIVVLVSILCLFVIFGGVLFGVMHVGGQQKVIQVISTPTSRVLPTPTPTFTATPTPVLPTPTLPPTPIPTVSYTANDIYNAFYANGLGGTNPKNDTNWSCCTYVPAGGAIVWTDSASGYTLDIATFYNNHDAEVDANDLFNQGYYSNVVHACLLSYEKDVPTSVLSGYVRLMQTYCN